MPILESRHPNSNQRFSFQPTAAQSEILGNRSGKQVERGVVELDDYSQAVEFFTRSMDGEEYADVWNLFMQYGMPVVPELWQDETGKIYMPNLTENGSGLYGKAFEQAHAEVAPKQADRIFLRVWESQKDTIRATAEQLADYASENGLLLPLDDPFDLQVNLDGSWNLIILDLEYGGTLPDLLQRKERFTTRQVDAQLQLEFNGKSLDSLNANEKKDLIYFINRKLAKTAYYTLQSAFDKLNR